MTSKREQLYKRRIAELEAQLRQRDARISALEKQVAELLKANEALVKKNAELAKQVTKLTDQVARGSKNSCNSSKPPSSDIVKPPKPKRSDGPRKQGGQPGHKGVNRQPFGPDRIDKTLEPHAGCCDCGYKGAGEPIEKPRIQQTVELRPDPVIISEYRLYGYICPKCGRVVWAQLSGGVIEGQLFGPRLQALIAYMKGSLHASYGSLEAFCRDVLDISRSLVAICATSLNVSMKPWRNLMSNSRNISPPSRS